MFYLYICTKLILYEQKFVIYWENSLVKLLFIYYIYECKFNIWCQEMGPFELNSCAINDLIGKFSKVVFFFFICTRPNGTQMYFHKCDLFVAVFVRFVFMTPFSTLLLRRDHYTHPCSYAVPITSTSCEILFKPLTATRSEEWIISQLLSSVIEKILDELGF